MAGRASHFFIFEDGELKEKLKNPFAVGGGGAGISVAKMLSDRGVKKLVAQKVGPNMAIALEERGIELEEGSGNIQNFLN